MGQDKTEKQLQDIFELKGCPGHGPRFDFSLLPPDKALRTMLERHKLAIQKWVADVRVHHAPTMGPIHFDYVENMEMNAFAFEADDHDFVGVYIGAIVTSYSFFGSLLSYPRFLPLIGNPAVEEEPKSAAFDPRNLFRQPKNPARRSFAHLVATLAIDFLFAHEIGHLMNGHIKFLKNTCGLSALAEFDTIKKTSEEYLVRQTLEMDADCFAVGQGLATAFGRAGDPDHVFPPDWRQWYATKQQCLFTWILAIYGFFRLFFKGTIDLDNLASTNHPPPSLRFRMTIGTLAEFLNKQQLAELVPEIQPIFGEVLETIERGQSVITATELNVSAIRQSVDRRAEGHIQRLLDNWKILRPQLVPLNRGGRLAD